MAYHDKYPFVNPKQAKPAPVNGVGKPRPPVAEFRNGQVQTRIYCNPTPWGGFEWKVNQVRVYPRAQGVGFSNSFSKRDLKDIARGALRAGRFIRRADWRIWCQRLVPWM